MNSVMLLGTIMKTETVDGDRPRTTITLETAGSGRYPDRHRCVAWGEVARTAATLDEGALVYVHGRLQTRSYDDKAGEKRWITEVVISGLKSISQRREDHAPPRGGDEPEDDITF